MICNVQCRSNSATHLHINHTANLQTAQKLLLQQIYSTTGLHNGCSNGLHRVHMRHKTGGINKNKTTFSVHNFGTRDQQQTKKE